MFVTLVAFVSLIGCESRDYVKYSGSTMGTSFVIQAKCKETLRSETITSTLDAMSSIFSTWEDDSIVSRFNRLEPEHWHEVPVIFLELVQISEIVSKTTRGAFDITVLPLVDAWGFGPQQTAAKPSHEAILTALDKVGYENLTIKTDPPSLRKQKPLQLDMSGIAKGYTVDSIADVMNSYSCSDFMVDIGGEIRVQGKNPFSNPWQVGIEVPDGSGHIFDILELSNIGIASSGDYRNFRIIDDVKYSHLINPITGYPVDHSLVAVTVLHKKVTYADAYATGLLILGLEQGIQIANELQLAALFISRDEESETFNVALSSSMGTYIKSE